MILKSINSSIHQVESYPATRHPVSDLKNAFTAAQVYFSDYPSGEVDPTSLEQYGYQISSNVNLTIVDGSVSGFSLTASHPSGSKTFTIDSEGNISPP